MKKQIRSANMFIDEDSKRIILDSVDKRTLSDTASVLQELEYLYSGVNPKYSSIMANALDVILDIINDEQ